MTDLLGADSLAEPQEPNRPPTLTPQEPENVYRRNIRARQEKARQQMVESFNVGVQQDPVKAREADRYARELGLPVGVAERKLDEVAKIVARRNFDAEQMAALNPTLAQQLRDPAFAKMAHDDIDNLSIYERAMRAAKIGWLTAERGRVGTRLSLPFNENRADMRRLAEIDEEMQSLGEPKGIVGNTAQFGGLMWAVGERATAAGLGAAGVAIIAGQMGPQALTPEEGVTAPLAFGVAATASTIADFAQINIGNEYANLVAMGVPRTTAQLTALGVGTVNTAIDVGGLSLLTAPIRQVLTKGARAAIVEGAAKPTIAKAALKAALSAAKAGGGEVGTEMLQELNSIIGEAAATGDPTKLDGAAARIGEVGLKTAQAMVLLSTPGPVMQFAQEARRVQAAKQAQQQLDTMMSATASGKMHAENPAAFRQTVDAASQGTSLYIDGKTFAETLAQRDVEEARESPDVLKKRLIERMSPELREKVADAITRGGDVVMTPGEFLTAFGNTPEGKALQQHIRFNDPEAITAAEAEKVDIDKLAKDAEKQVDEQQKAAEQWTQEAQEVERGIYEQVVAAGRKPDEAKADAQLWRSFVETQAERLQETPRQFADRYKVEVEQGDVEADATKQEGGATRGGFSRSGNVLRITLTPDANASTFIHEGAHAFLEIYGDLANEKAHPAILDDFRKLLQWGGVKDEAAWKAMTIDQRRGMHERFAREFEAFVWEGKEPSAGLKGLFARLMRFLRRVYDNLRAIPEAQGVPDDIRAVMERMLASEQEVQVAQSIRGAVPLFQTQEESGLDDAAWAKHVERQKAADEAAVDEVVRSDLRNMKWLRLQVGRMQAENRKEVARLREGERQKVAAEIERQPIYRAMRWLKTGEMVNPDGTKSATEGVHKLATAMVPESQRDKLRGMTVAEGLAPDDVAPLFGLETGEQMVREIAEAPPLLDAIEARTDEVMLEKHTDLMDPRKRDATIERALHNETRRRFVASELDALMKAQQPARVMLAAAKKAAEVALSSKRVKEINPRAFTMAARRSSLDAAGAQKAGKLDEAIAAKRREMVQSEMALLAMDVQKEVAKAEALFKGAERSDKDLAKSRDIDYVYALRSLGAKFGFREPIEAGQRTELTNTALAKLVDERPDLASRLATLSSLAAGGLQYRDVALSLFREVADLSEVLWTAARDAQILLADGKRRKVSEAVEALVGQVGSLPPPNSTKALPAGGATPPWRSAMLTIWNVLAATKRMESVAWWLDGNKVGPFTRLIVQPIVKAEAKRNAAKAKMVASVHADLVKVKEAAGAAWLAKIHSEELDYTFANKSELLRALLYMGTDSGARKWLLGERGKNGQPLGDLVPDADGAMVLDTSRWDRFIAKKWNDGTLTKADADFLKAMWGRFRELLPQAQAVHKASTGFEYETLAERPMVTPFGTLEGGYVPVRVNYDKAKPTPNYLKLDDIGKQRENIGFSIGTERGFSLKRNENYLQPLTLDLGKLLAHLDEELTFIHMELPVRDVARIAQGSMEVQNPDGTTSKVKLLDVLNGYDRTILPNVMQPWLENVALQRTTRPGKWPAVDRAAMLLRKVSSLSRLAFNVTNSLLQATGISVAATQVPRSFVWSALSTVLKNPAAAVRDMLANSEAMRVKNDVETVRLQQDMARLNLGSVRGGIKAAQQFAGAVGFWLTRKVQALADVVTWQAAKAHAEAGGADLEAAVQAADGAVRRSQGDTNPSGLAAFEVQTPAIQLLFQFGTYSNTILNTLMASRSRASAVVWAVLIPALVESLLRQAVRPPEDDDGDGIIDEMAWSYAETTARSVAGLVPLVGPTALAALKSEGTRVQDAPAVSTIKDAVAGLYALVEAMGGDETTAAEWRKIAVLLTSVTQIPVAAPTGLAQDLTGTAR